MKNENTNMTVEQAQSTIEFCEYAFRNMDLSDAAFDKCLAEYGAAKAVINNAAKLAETEETVETAEQVAEVSAKTETGKALSGLVAKTMSRLDFDNPTKFEVGKTYYGATWEGEFNPNGAVIVKKLTVTKITPKTICTVDENGLARRSKFTEAYAGTTEGFTIGTPNGYVDIYAFNEYTPAVAAVPTDNYTVWSEAALAIREGKTPEVNTMNTAAETDGSEDDAEINEVFSLLPALDETDSDDETDEPEILNADKWVNLYFSPAHEKNGSTYVNIGDNKLSFSRHELYSITDERHGFELKFNNGKKLFYSTRFNAAVMRVLPQITSAKKVIETYMNRELAAEQEKNFRNFFLADVRKNSTGFYNVMTTVTFADDVDHNYGVNFDKFSDAQAFVEEVKNFVGNVPAYITIRSHQNIYYHRTQDGSETYNVDPEQLNLIDEYAISKSAFNVAVEAEEKAAATVESELTGKMKWAIELLGDYTYEFEGDWEAGNGGLARHYKRFNRYGEECGKVVEVFTDKTSFILDHVNIVDKSIRTYYYINGEQLSYLNGEFNFLWSNKYKAGMNVVGGEHLQVEVPDGQWKKYKNFMVNNDEFFQIMSERGACTIGETEPPETPATVAPVETNLTDKYQAALEGVYVEDEVGDFVPAAGMTNVAKDNLMVYRNDSGFMEEDPDKYVELLDMEEELEDVMMDEKIAEENRKLDEAFAKTKLGAPELTHGMKLAAQIVASIGNSPLELVNFGYGEYGAPRYVYETADYKFSVTEAMTDCSPDRRLEYVEVFDYATMTKTVYDFKPVLSDELKKFRIECDAAFAKLEKSTEPPAESFTTKRDRLIAERAFANVTFAEAEKNFKAAKLAKYNADDKLYTFMVSAIEELNEKLLPLPDAEIEVKTMEGYLTFIYPETVYADFTDMKFTLRGDCSELNGVTLGTYDTPEQVERAVEQFKAAIERDDKRFDFANPGQNFDKRAMRASLERAMKIALERHEGFVKLGQMTAAENEMKLYAICHDALAALK